MWDVANKNNLYINITDIIWTLVIYSHLKQHNTIEEHDFGCPE